MNTGNLIELQKWYKSKCNGIWEHEYGLTIDTLDNPGWEVQLSGESGKKTLEIIIENSDEDWFCIKADESKFYGYGGIDNLDIILEYASLWIHNDSFNLDKSQNFEKDFGREIGTNGETKLRVILDPIKKKIITSFPE